MVVVSRVRVSGPLESYVPGFAEALAARGLSPQTIVFRMQLLADLSRWMAGEAVEVGALSSEVVARFVACRRAVGYVRYLTTGAVAPLIDYLADAGAVPVATERPESLSEVEVLLERYRCYLTDERQLSAAVVASRVVIARSFLDRLAGTERDAVPLPSASDVSAFVVAECSRYSRGQAKLIVTALRSLLRFLAVEGRVELALIDAVPAVAGWRFSGLPKRLEAGQVERLLASCDRSTVIGRRDFAIITLLAGLGLRCGEAAALQLADIDWRAGEITVCGKGDRWQRLPLVVQVGEAIADYLRDGRGPAAVDRSVFVRVRAPRRGLSPRGIGAAVAGAGQRAGLGAVYPHRLRHTLASELLGAGASLGEVGQVLGHRSLDSTAIYAKVNREALRELAGCWPEVAA